MKFLTPKQASAVLSIHPETLRKWEAKGRISSQRTPGGHRRFLESDVLALQDQMLEGAFERDNQQIIEESMHTPQRVEAVDEDSLNKSNFKSGIYFLAVLFAFPLFLDFMPVSFPGFYLLAFPFGFIIYTILLTKTAIDLWEISKYKIIVLLLVLCAFGGFAYSVRSFENWQKASSQVEHAKQTRQEKKVESAYQKNLSKIKCKKAKDAFVLQAKFVMVDNTIRPWDKEFKLESAAKVANTQC